jgi:hypothetical protein
MNKIVQLSEREYKELFEKVIPIQETRCICVTCGTMLSDPETSYCINGHDDWLEPYDNIETFIRASENLGMSITELKNKISHENI